jgi:hypothetical protein
MAGFRLRNSGSIIELDDHHRRGREARLGATGKRGDDLPAIGLVSNDHDRLTAAVHNPAEVGHVAAGAQSRVALALDAER